MAKKISFALEMADGYAVRHELEEYRAHEKITMLPNL